MSGIDRQFPNGINQTDPLNNTCYDDRQLGYGGRCPVGHYCPAGVAAPVECDNGTYAATEGLSQCLTCPEGKSSTGVCLSHRVPGLTYHCLSVY